MITPKPHTEADEFAEREEAEAMFDAMADALAKQAAATKEPAAPADPAAPLVGRTIELGKKNVVTPKSVEEHIAARQKKHQLTRDEYLAAQGDNKFVGPEGFGVFDNPEFFTHYVGPNQYAVTFDWYSVIDRLSEKKEGWRFLPYDMHSLFKALQLSSEAEFAIFAIHSIPHMLLYTSGLWLMLDGSDDLRTAKQVGATDHNRFRHTTMSSFHYSIYLDMVWQQISAPGDPMLDSRGHVQEATTKQEAVAILAKYQEYRDLVDVVDERRDTDMKRAWLEHCKAYLATGDIKWGYSWGIECIRIRERAILSLCNIHPDLWERFLTPKCRPLPEHCHPECVQVCANNIIAMCHSAKTTCLRHEASDRNIWFIEEKHTPEVLDTIKTPDQYAEIIIGEIFKTPRTTYLTEAQRDEVRQRLNPGSVKPSPPVGAAPPVAPRVAKPKAKKPTGAQKREAARQELKNRVAHDRLGAPEDEPPVTAASPPLSDEEKAARLLELKRAASATVAAMEPKN